MLVILVKNEKQKFKISKNNFQTVKQGKQKKQKILEIKINKMGKGRETRKKMKTFFLKDKHLNDLLIIN